MEKPNDLKEFVSQVLRLKQIRNRHSKLTFISGSVSELPLEYVASNVTDFDIMRIIGIFIAISETELIPNDKLDFFRSRIVVIVESDGVPPGFTRLRVDEVSMTLPNDMSVSIKNALYLTHGVMLYGSKEINGPARTSLVIDLPSSLPLDGFHSKVNSPLQTTDGQKFSVDKVFCLWCKSWPNEATEWMHRSRSGSWPSPDLIDRITSGGCHLVAKPHPCYPSDRTMFRFSFSVAETLLIQSLNPVQRYIYHILRLVKTEVVKRVDSVDYKTELCTYHFKTLMMWSCEERPSEFWDETHIATSVGELLCQVIEWLIDKSCPNYFIRKNNMMESFTSDMTTEIELLLDIRNRICHNDSFVFQHQNRKRIHIPISRDLLTLGLITFTKIMTFDRTVFTRTDSSDLVSVLPPRTDKLIHEEFLDLYRPISAHRQLVISDLNKQYYANMAEYRQLFSIPEEREIFEYFNRSTAKSQKCYDVSFELSDPIGENFNRMLWKPEEYCRSAEELLPGNIKRLNASFLSSLCSCLAYLAAEPRREIEFFRDLPEISDLEVKFTELHAAEFFNALDKRFPRISYFFSMAYRANFYYSYRKEYATALRLCSEAQICYTELELISGAATTADYTCLVIISSKWMPIYDRYIQTVFGLFVTLKRLEYDFGKRKRSRPNRTETTFVECMSSAVVLVNPSEFFRYLECCCLLQTNQDGMTHVAARAFGLSHELLLAAAVVEIKEHKYDLLAKALIQNRITTLDPGTDPALWTLTLNPNDPNEPVYHYLRKQSHYHVLP